MEKNDENIKLTGNSSPPSTLPAPVSSTLNQVAVNLENYHFPLNENYKFPASSACSSSSSISSSKVESAEEAKKDRLGNFFNPALIPSKNQNDDDVDGPSPSALPMQASPKRRSSISETNPSNEVGAVGRVNLVSMGRRHSLMAPISFPAGSRTNGGLSPLVSQIRLGRSVEFNPVVMMQGGLQPSNSSNGSAILKPILKKTGSRNIASTTGSRNILDSQAQAQTHNAQSFTQAQAQPPLPTHPSLSISVHDSNKSFSGGSVQMEQKDRKPGDIISSGILQNGVDGPVIKHWNSNSINASTSGGPSSPRSDHSKIDQAKKGGFFGSLFDTSAKGILDNKSRNSSKSLKDTSLKEIVTAASHIKSKSKTSLHHNASHTGSMAMDSSTGGEGTPFGSYISSSSTKMSTRNFYIGHEESSRLLLSFKDEEVEDMYLGWFTKRYHGSWLRTQIAIAALLLVYGIYNLFHGYWMTSAYSILVDGQANIPYYELNDTALIKALDGDSAFDAVLLVPGDHGDLSTKKFYIASNGCPVGLYCADSYPMGLDCLFVILFQLLPIAISYVVGKYMSFDQFKRYNQLITSISTLVVILFGILLREQVINASKVSVSATGLSPIVTPLGPTIISIVFMLSVIMFARLRFLYTICTNIFWLGSFIPVFTYWLQTKNGNGQSRGSNVDGRIMYDYSGITIISLTLGSLISLILSYEAERTSRSLFFHENLVRVKSRKLTEQLMTLRKSNRFNPNDPLMGIVDLESPLEKSLSILRGLLADPNLSKAQVDQLSAIMSILITRGNNLLIPDWSNTKDPFALMATSALPKSATDNEQEAWMVNEFLSRSGNNSYHNLVYSKNGAKKPVNPGSFNKGIFSSTKLKHGDNNDNDNDNESSLTHDSNNTSMPALSMTSLGAVSAPMIKSGSYRKPIIGITDEADAFQNEPMPPEADTVPAVLRSYIDRFFASPLSMPDSQSLTIIWYDFLSEYFEKYKLKSDSGLLASDIRAKLSDYNAELFVKFRGSDAPAIGYKSKRDLFLDCLGDMEWQSFNVFALSYATFHHPLTFLSIHLFERYNLLGHFKIPIKEFFMAVYCIEKGYRSSLPYHNSVHAADVLHAVSCFLDLIWWDKDMQRLVSVSPVQSKPDVSGAVEANTQALMFDIFALLLASMIHDYDHPGVNNNFLIATKSPWAVLYNDRHVLENHHVSQAFQQVLNRSESNFLSCLGPLAYRSMRSNVIDLVLATDLANHFEIVNFFKGKLAAASGNNPNNNNNPNNTESQTNTAAFGPERNREDQMLLLKVLLKSADVSNASKPFALYGTWVMRILQEFCSQGDSEKSMGLPVSPFMDKESIQVSTSQRGFIDVVCKPLLENLVTFLLIHASADAVSNSDTSHDDSDDPPKLQRSSTSRIDALDTSCAKAMIVNLQKNRKVWDTIQGLPVFVRWDGIYGIKPDLDIDFISGSTPPPPMPKSNTPEASRSMQGVNLISSSSFNRRAQTSSNLNNK